MADSDRAGMLERFTREIMMRFGYTSEEAAIIYRVAEECTATAGLIGAQAGTVTVPVIGAAPGWIVGAVSGFATGTIGCFAARQPGRQAELEAEARRAFDQILRESRTGVSH